MDRDDVLRTNEDSIQQAEIVCGGLSQNCLTGKEKEAVINISEPSDKSTRYTVTVVDPEEPVAIENMTFAAFVVPLGKETEWIFSSVEGRQILRENCGFDRVALISMHVGHEYPDFKGIRDELMDSIVKLAPIGVQVRGEKILFLTVGANMDDNSNHKIRVCDESLFSGKFIVEDVMEKDVHLRRLIFLNRESGIQSEVKLKKVGDKEELDFNCLRCEYYILMCIGVSLAVNQEKKPEYKILLVGLGGGVLAVLFHKFFKKAFITAVEIDSKIYDVAKEHFYLKTDDRMQVSIDDGLLYLSRKVREGSKYDVILFDVDNKDCTLGISAPPLSFLQLNVLNEVTRCLTDKGLFVMNLNCRSQELRKEALEKLQTIFAGVISIKSKVCVNEVVICWKNSLHISAKHIEKAVEDFCESLKEENIIFPEDISNIIDLLENIKV